MYLLTGSSSAILPRSTSIIAGTLVMVLVTEWIGKMVSAVIGVSRLDVALAEALEIDRLAVALDQNDGAGNRFRRRSRPLMKSSIRESFSERQRRVRRRAEIGG